SWTCHRLPTPCPAAVMSSAVTAITSLDSNTHGRSTDGCPQGSVSGSPAAIEKLQRGPYHNFQRVDAPHVEVNPLATALRGWAGGFMMKKNAGGLLVETSLSGSSPGFD